MEDPTFPGAIDAFRTAGGRILTVPVHHSEADVGMLAATISQSPVRAIYLMPTFHNPVGTVMPEPARRELARFSRVSGVPIIEDNTLAELALGCKPPPPLAAHARDAPITEQALLGGAARRLDPRPPIRDRPAWQAEGGRRPGHLTV